MGGWQTIGTARAHALAFFAYVYMQDMLMMESFSSSSSPSSPVPNQGILERGAEVELSLLGLQESVALLTAVAEIDADQTPPCCLEIARLCGRLPLCLNVRYLFCVFCVKCR